jgi:hypothetical protein
MRVSGSACLLFHVVTIARKNECLCQHSFFILSSNGQDVQVLVIVVVLVLVLECVLATQRLAGARVNNWVNSMKMEKNAYCNLSRATTR